jgi:hypothetical protein
MTCWSDINSSHKGPSPFNNEGFPYTNLVDLDLLYGSSYWQNLPSIERKALHGMIKGSRYNSFSRKRTFKEPNGKNGFFNKANPQEEVICYLCRIRVLIMRVQEDKTTFTINPIYL